MKFNRRGIMLIIASPSGAGKSSISRNLLEQDKNLSLSVSLTTRKMREGEIDGKDYHFISVEKFKQMREAGEVLEWAKVHDNYYATPKAQIEEKIAKGQDVIFDIDYQGTQQLYERCRSDMVSVFILPPSIKELHSRLKKRALDSNEVIARRLKNARIEIEHWAEYDYVLVNEDLEETTKQVGNILKTARLARIRQRGLADFIKQLQGEIDNL